MERERLTRLLEDPSRSTRDDAAHLRAMAEQYPWFTSAQLLHAASERAHGNVLADEALRTAATHLPSRAVLRDLIEQEATPTPLRVVRTAQTAVAPEVSTPPLQPMMPLAPVDQAQTLPQVPAEPFDLPIQGAEPPEPAAEPREDEIAPETVLLEEEPLPGPMEVDEEPPLPLRRPTEPTAAHVDQDELDQQVTRAALASAFDLTLTEPLPLAAEVHEAALAPAQAPLRATPSSRLRFSAWLEAAVGAEEKAGVMPRAASSKFQVQGSTRKNEQEADSEKPVARSEGAPLAASLPTNPLAANDLIDRFIKQQPPEIPPKPAFFTPQQAAKKSLDDTAGLVTETLARIYGRQGNIPKAIEAYRRLALKYPDKSAYFAALSKALEEQQTP
jgi:hypothetical protein